MNHWHHILPSRPLILSPLIPPFPPFLFFLLQALFTHMCKLAFLYSTHLFFRASNLPCGSPVSLSQLLRGLGDLGATFFYIYIFFFFLFCLCFLKLRVDINFNEPKYTAHKLSDKKCWVSLLELCLHLAARHRGDEPLMSIFSLSKLFSF